MRWLDAFEETLITAMAPAGRRQAGNWLPISYRLIQKEVKRAQAHQTAGNGMCMEPVCDFSLQKGLQVRGREI